MIQDTKVQALVNALGLESTREGVQTLLDRCIKKGHKCRIRYVKKELFRMPDDVVIYAPTISVSKEEFKEMYPDKDPMDEVYTLHLMGKSWPEITKLTGVKSPWIKVKKYAKANDLEYPIK